MEVSKSLNFLYRDIIKKIDKWLERDEIIVILGARQVGKTSVLRLLQTELVSAGKKTYFIDLEDIEIRNALKTVRNVISYLTAMGWRKEDKEITYVFLDEIHYMENCTSILKYIHDHYPRLKFIVSGSSSLKLKFQMAEPLTGRKVVFILYPLSFLEFLEFTNRVELSRIIKQYKSKPIPEPFLSQINSAYEEYIIYGGYPKVALTPEYEMKVKVLKEIQTTYLEKEIRSLVAEESFVKFSSFVEFLATQNGGLLKSLEISKEVGIARNTVIRYLSILEETFIIKTLRPWAKSRAKEIIKMPRLFFLDTGFLNYTLKTFQNLSLRANSGLLVESGVYVSLLQYLGDMDELRYWRTKAGEEIDFLLRRENRIIPIEVKWSGYPKISNAFRKFIKENPVDKGYILTKNSYKVERVNNCQIKFFPAWAIPFELE